MTALQRVLIPILISVCICGSSVGMAFASSQTIAQSVDATPLLIGTVASVQGVCNPPTLRKIKTQDICTFDVTEPSGVSATIAAKLKTVWTWVTSAAVVSGFGVTDSVAVRCRASQASCIAVRVWYNPTPFTIPQSKVKTSSGKLLSDNTTVAPNQFTITKGASQLVFNVSPNTHYRLNGKVATAPTLIPGDALRIWWVPYTDGNNWTTIIWITRHKQH
jgi:hypothetical protein